MVNEEISLTFTFYYSNDQLYATSIFLFCLYVYFVCSLVCLFCFLFVCLFLFWFVLFFVLFFFSVVFVLFCFWFGFQNEFFIYTQMKLGKQTNKKINKLVRYIPGVYFVSFYFVTLSIPNIYSLTFSADPGHKLFECCFKASVTLSATCMSTKPAEMS